MTEELAALRELCLRLAERIYLAHEVIAMLAERKEMRTK